MKTRKTVGFMLKDLFIILIGSTWFAFHPKYQFTQASEIHNVPPAPYETILGPSDLREAYFNGTAYMRLHTTISLHKHIGISFRTCTGGELFSQRYGNYSIEVSVHNDRLVFSATTGSTRYNNIIQRRQPFTDNRWHTVNLEYRFGNLTLSIDDQQEVLANATYQSELITNHNLSNESGILIIGSSYTGCILEGPSLVFNISMMESHFVFFGSCPISKTSCTVRGDLLSPSKTASVVDHCLPQPCMGNGECISHADTYECKCTARYTSKNCEIELKPPCERLSTPNKPLCQNGATCMEDNSGNYSCVCPPDFTGTHCEIMLKSHILCASSPCRNNGICHASQTPNQYECLCASGFTGVNCEININECETNMCQNGGLCVDGINNYTCLCQNTGYQGNHCEININECELNPCSHRGVCFDTYGGYICQCQNGFYGKNCEMNNDCVSTPCLNGGICIDREGGYECRCHSGYIGQQCEVRVTACTNIKCPPNSDCVEHNNSYECVCRHGYFGTSGLEPNCVENSACISKPCLNGGVCNSILNGESFNCTCLPGFTGKVCQLDIDDCASFPCLNDGVCIDLENGFQCNCTDMWMGVTCEQPYDACEVLQPCENNATCTLNPHNRKSFACNCLSGFDGPTCANNINDCVSVTCPPNHICYDGINSYECGCPRGYSGDNCTLQVNHCAQPSPCVNGTCINTNDSYICKCNKGYTGVNCEIDIDECAIAEPNQNQICNNGICVNIPGSFQCYCKPGYTGDRCDQDFDECLSQPCKHNAICLNKINEYKCVCPQGYTSKDCSVNINECDSNPCVNGSTCVDGIASFSCICPAGLTGKFCENDIDDCWSSPCSHGGQCIDHLNSYSCNCDHTGYSGSHCEINIDDCYSNPCKHGAKCEDGVNDYLCHCSPGYTGKNCETDIDECTQAPCKHGICLQRSNQSLYDPYFSQNLNITLPDIFLSEFSYENASGYECVCEDGVVGRNCDINVDECLSSPCIGGQCNDLIGGYECVCDEGFEGVLCEHDIDECLKYKPCVHGTCMDRRADYVCDCISGYGGKNCSVELLGCQEKGKCLNDGICKPYLESEIEHKFNCSCPHGFHGPTCEKVTTMSINNSSYILVNTSRDEGYDIQFRFKTTLANGLLAIGRGYTFYILQLVQGRLNLQSSLLNKWAGVFIGSSLNDSKWQKVFVTINSSHLVLAANEEQTIYPINLNEGSNASHTSFPTTYIGGTTVELRQLPQGPPYFIGCAEDVVVNGEWVLPQNNSLGLHSGPATTLVNVQVGCPREPQCHPNPCFSGGHCTDLWSTFSCACKRPYIGQTCQYNFTAATFGYENTTNSLVTVTVTEAERRAVRSIVLISMFIRTRQSKGQIFYLGSALTSANFSDETYIATQLDAGDLLLIIQFNGASESYPVGVKLDNGYDNLIEVSRNVTFIQVKINDTEYFRKTISATGQLDVQTLYLGGFPQLSRSVRQADITSMTSTSGSTQHRAVKQLNTSVANFKGIIQDVQISNGASTMIVEFFPLNASDLIIPPSFGLVTFEKNSILEGVLSDDMCRINPCHHNGTCYNTWNDFGCVCTRGYKGKNCEDIEFCELQDCPKGSVCRDLKNGYECIANATFDGKTTSLSYNFTSLNETVSIFTSIEIVYRSNDGGTIFHAIDDKEYFIISVYKDEVITQWKLNGNRNVYRFKKDIPDGNWTELFYTIKDDTLIGGFKDLVKDDIPNISSSGFDFDAFNKLITRSTIVLGGGYSKYDKDDIVMYHDKYSNSTFITSDNIIGRDNLDLEHLTYSDMQRFDVKIGEDFKGCLGEVRIGQYLLPYFLPQELHGRDSLMHEYFSLITEHSNLGPYNRECFLCFDTDCKHGGHCLNPHSEYICECPIGFKSNDCSIDIDECEDNTCQNNSTCIDKIGNYTCDCALGWEGWLCDIEINECLSNPCQNGGTCVDLLGNFKCECLDTYIGQSCESLRLITCDNMPCSNGSTCIDEKNTQTGNNYTCACAPGFEGTVCNIPFCELRSCVHGYCNKTEGVTPICECERGYVGNYCEINVDDCILPSGEQPCQNNGKCIDDIDKYECNCTGTGYTGLLCEIDIDECEAPEIFKLCGKSGVCVNTPGSYRCQCGPGFCGFGCALIDPCHIAAITSLDGDIISDEENLICGKHGTCEEMCDNQQKFKCICKDGYFGQNCSDIETSPFNGTTSFDIAVIVIPTVIILLLIGAGALAVFLAMARSKRATRGTYSPSAQEFCNPRVEMDNVLKPPPEERLI